MFTRIGLFLLTNIAVIALLSLVFLVLENVFWIQLTGYSYLLVFASVIWFGWAFISLQMSRWVAKKSYKLQIINRDQVNQLSKKEKAVWNTVLDLAERNHIVMPEVAIYQDREPNAFATGPSKNKSLVAVSSWLLESMDIGAIEGVVGHEMAHILNGDMVTMTLLQWVVNTFVIFIARVVANIISNFLDENLSWFAHMGLVIFLEIIFWLFASIIVMAFSRHREFKADAWSAKFLWKEKMIAGLEALKKMQSITSWDTSKLATMKISTKNKTGIKKLFSSHPNLQDRIDALNNSNI